eukprot:SAG11_NODE_6335_length_1334_cov_1.237247_1_plen_77_part_00
MLAEGRALESESDNNSARDTDVDEMELLALGEEAAQEATSDNEALSLEESALCENVPDLKSLGSRVAPCRSGKPNR